MSQMALEAREMRGPGRRLPDTPLPRGKIGLRGQVSQSKAGPPQDSCYGFGCVQDEKNTWPNTNDGGNQNSAPNVIVNALSKPAIFSHHA
jgi:hypothetical protein